MVNHAKGQGGEMLASDPAQCYFGLWRVDKEGFPEYPPISAGGIVYREDRVCL